DVYVIRHERDAGARQRRGEAATTFDMRQYAWAGLVCLITTGMGMFVYHVLGKHGETLSNTNALMIHLLAVLFVATRFGRGPAMAASLFSVSAFAFTVVPPYYTFSVNDSQYLFTFMVILATALL